MTSATAFKRTSHPALGGLADARLLRELAYVDGRWTQAANAASFEVRDPFSGDLLAHVASLGAEEAGRAVDAGEERSEERRVGKECRSRWSPYH